MHIVHTHSNNEWHHISFFQGRLLCFWIVRDDDEWFDCLAEAANWATGQELRQLFVIILANYQVSDTPNPWKRNYAALSEDITTLQCKDTKLTTWK